MLLGDGHMWPDTLSQTMHEYGTSDESIPIASMTRRLSRHCCLHTRSPATPYCAQHGTTDMNLRDAFDTPTPAIVLAEGEFGTPHGKSANGVVL